MSIKICEGVTDIILEHKLDDSPESTAATYFKSWLDQFINDASYDNQLVLENRLEEFVGVNAEDAHVISATIHLVLSSVSYRLLDGIPMESIKNFLGMQAYSESNDLSRRFVFMFNLGRDLWGRIISQLEVPVMDLADLISQPWDYAQTVGYTQMCISRVDMGILSDIEIEDIKAFVTYDIRFDYSEDELDISFYVPDDLKSIWVYIDDPDIGEVDS